MIKRRFIVGSEWIFLKIYSGPKTLEGILINDIRRKVNSLVKSGAIDQYFFIRYADPEYHIRLRLHCLDQERYMVVLNEVNEWLDYYTRKLIVTKVQWDTYARELERYGGDLMPYYEKLFFYDSRFIMDYLGGVGCLDQDRFLVSMKYMDALMNQCGMSLGDRISFAKKNRDAYFQEIYKSNEDIGHLVNRKYRQERKRISDMLDADDLKSGWQRALKRYMKQIGPILDTVRQKDFHHELTSLIHMHVNRMFRTEQRLSEFVIYWYLHKYYQSKEAMTQNSGFKRKEG